MNKINSIRKDWSLIETLIAEDRKILDIGCGDGGLMEQLENNRNAITHGIELNRDLAANAIARGFNVVHGNAELDLSQYSNNSFDYVILSQTLQAMMKPKDILSELLRIGSKAIVSFPNFGHWKIRLQLLISGKMPVTESLPYTWYDTPNIHFFTIKDFLNLCNEMNIVIEKSIGLTSKGKQFDISESVTGVNFFTHEAIFLLSYKNFEPIKIKSSKKVFDLMELLMKNRRIDLFDDVAKSFIVIYNKMYRNQDVIITSSSDLSSSTIEKIESKVKELTSKNIKLINKVDSSIVGGFVLRIGDLQYDASFKNQLNKLKQDFINISIQ